jgi:hypothetical protein
MNNPFVDMLRERLGKSSDDPAILAAMDEIERLSEEVRILADDKERLMEELEKCWNGDNNAPPN